jgi:hypothetical protein
VNWTEGGTQVSTSASYNFTLSGNRTLVANFQAVTQQQYTITVQNDGNGTASANLTSATAGTSITLTATPNAGYQFQQWQVISGGVTIVNSQFTMPSQNATVKAIFEVATANETVNAPSVDVWSINGNLTVKSGSPMGMVNVYNLSGQLVKTVNAGGECEVNVYDLPRGVLIVKVIVGDQVATKKLMN